MLLCSVDYCTAEDAWAVMSAPPAGLEDGTLGFLNIASLKHGFAMLDRLGGIKVGVVLLTCLLTCTVSVMSQISAVCCCWSQYCEADHAEHPQPAGAQVLGC